MEYHYISHTYIYGISLYGISKRTWNITIFLPQIRLRQNVQMGGEVFKCHNGIRGGWTHRVFSCQKKCPFPRGIQNRLKMVYQSKIPERSFVLCKSKLVKKCNHKTRACYKIITTHGGRTLKRILRQVPLMLNRCGHSSHAPMHMCCSMSLGFAFPGRGTCVPSGLDTSVISLLVHSQI